MPRFEPFRGLRYAPGVPIGQVMAPPYDVISSAERVHLASRHPANAVLVELPEPDLQGGRDRYQVAAALFTRWQAEGILRPDPIPCLYPYRMTDTTGRASTGVIGALGLADPGAGERHPAPRADASRSPRATVSICSGPPGPTSRRSGACRCGTG